MKIIDWENRGHLVRFYLGKDDLKKWWGDDWNDAPYDCNAGTVYREYIEGHLDHCFPWDTVLVFAPGDNLTKDDLAKRKCPFLVVLTGEQVKEMDKRGLWTWQWLDVMTYGGGKQIFFGDDPRDHML